MWGVGVVMVDFRFFVRGCGDGVLLGRRVVGEGWDDKFYVFEVFGDVVRIRVWVRGKGGVVSC